MLQKRSNLRGTFVVDNDRKLVERIKRGDNIKWIIAFLYSNPCARAHECKRALLAWRGYEVSDRSRGQYASYFYDRYSQRWYYDKIWKVECMPGDKKKRMVLTAHGMGLVDLSLSEKIAKWNKKPSVRITVDKKEKASLIGLCHDSIFSSNP